MKSKNLSGLTSLFYSKSTVIFHELYLDDFAKSWKNDYGIRFERYNKRDAGILKDSFSRLDTPQRFDLIEVDRLLKDGHLFYVAKKDEQIIGYTWFAVKKIDIAFYNATLYLNQKEVFAFYAYIDRDYRGKRLYNTLLAFAFTDLKKKGFSRVIGSYSTNNTAAKRASEHLGRKPFGCIKYYSILTLRFEKSGLSTNKILFYGGPFILWKKKILPKLSGLFSAKIYHRDR